MERERTGLISIVKLLHDFAKSENHIIGFCDALPLSFIQNPDTPFVSRDVAMRQDPSACLPGAKSIIVVGVKNENRNNPPMPTDAGILSVLSVSDDYHVIVKNVINKLISEIKNQMDFAYKILVDSPYLDERRLAVKAGLGYIGKNGLVITKEFGTRFNIGLLLTDIDIDDGTVLKCDDYMMHCSDSCNRCIKACPTGALSDTTRCNVLRCISYLTQKNNITSEEAVLVGSHLYGCDICQDVCPKNQPQQAYWAIPEDWLSMSDDDFKDKYGNTAMMWRGAKLLRRNAKIVINNRATLSQDQLVLPQN